MTTIKVVSILLILSMTILAGSYPFIKKMKDKSSIDFPLATSLAAGVFLGAGLIHMLGDASKSFNSLHYEYPFAFLLAGVTFLLLLLLEHIGSEIYKKEGENPAFAIIAVVMLSFHSFLAGAALGLSGSLSITLVILGAILAHKWAASFSLSVHINRSNIKMKTGLILFTVFSLMTPLGIVMGDVANRMIGAHPLIEPILISLAAGTFLYLGTLHGLERATMIKKCCNLKHFCYVLVGFALMAVVAIWT